MGGERIDLARELDFDLGAIRVRPALREIRSGDWIETLEPRVMQVLIALARARGEVVSRDALLQSCWSGRAVSDDVIYRCVGQVRRLLDDKYGLCSVRTVARVGYSLTPVSHPQPQPLPANRKSDYESLNDLIGHIY
jgi:DNA-binding winged helix-turn-helix (wHTH) protein